MSYRNVVIGSHRYNSDHKLLTMDVMPELNSNGVRWLVEDKIKKNIDSDQAL